MLAGGLDKALRAAVGEFEQLKAAGQKGELSHICISFLLSGVLCRQPLLRIDLLDIDEAQGGIAAAECSVYWEALIISDALYHEAELIAKQSDDIKDYEIERLWLERAGHYFMAFEKWMPDIKKACESLKDLDCKVSFGQYLGIMKSVS